MGVVPASASRFDDPMKSLLVLAITGAGEIIVVVGLLPDLSDEKISNTRSPNREVIFKVELPVPIIDAGNNPGEGNNGSTLFRVKATAATCL